jgi:hypothetical protein
MSLNLDPKELDEKMREAKKMIREDSLRASYSGMFFNTFLKKEISTTSKPSPEFIKHSMNEAVLLADELIKKLEERENG